MKRPCNLRLMPGGGAWAAIIQQPNGQKLECSAVVLSSPNNLKIMARSTSSAERFPQATSGSCACENGLTAPSAVEGSAPAYLQVVYPARMVRRQVEKNFGSERSFPRRAAGWHLPDGHTVVFA